MMAQHEEACEFGRALIEALECGDERDARLFLKRFRAIVEHNMIEEERDLFPIAERVLTTQDVMALLRKLSERDKG
jgi:hypothetical protein